MSGVIVLFVLFVAGALVYRFRRPILDALARFDARNAAKRAEEMRDRADRFAHYRHTIRLAAEQVEDVIEIAVPDERTGLPAARFVFAGETFVVREDAEAAREAAILIKAREFYVELPAELARRRAPDTVGKTKER